MPEDKQPMPRPPGRVYGPDDLPLSAFDAFNIPNCRRPPEYWSAYGAYLDRDCPHAPQEQTR